MFEKSHSPDALGLFLGRFFLSTEKENRMQLLCDSPSIQKAAHCTDDPELSQLITGYIERLSDL